MAFDNEKKINLQKIKEFDKSRRKAVDQEILPLVEKISSKEDYYTTSSCSGRIVLLNKPSSGKKYLSTWLYSSHSEAKPEEVLASLSKHKKGETWFMMEPFILHVCCRTLEDASRLLYLANSAGIKRAGLISVRKRFILEIIGTDTISTLAAKGKDIVADEGYIRILVKEANRKLKKNQKKIDKLYRKIAGRNQR